MKQLSRTSLDSQAHLLLLGDYFLINGSTAIWNMSQAPPPCQLRLLWGKSTFPPGNSALRWMFLLWLTWPGQKLSFYVNSHPRSERSLILFIQMSVSVNFIPKHTSGGKLFILSQTTTTFFLILIAHTLLLFVLTTMSRKIIHFSS